MKAFAACIDQFIFFGIIFLGFNITDLFAAEDQNHDSLSYEASSLADLSLEELLNLKVTASSKFSQTPTQAPNAVNVIHRSNIRDYGWLTINDILSRQSGFNLSHDYERNTISSRGMFESWNNNHLLLLMDGIPFNDAATGTAFTFENTPIFLIDSLEVIRGPGSTLYGSNATNGVISIHTPSGAQMNHQSEIKTRLGNLGTSFLDVTTGGNLPLFSYFIGYNQHDTKGFNYLSSDISERYPTPFEIRNGLGNRYFLLKLEGNRNLKDLTIEFHNQYWNYQTGHGWLHQIPEFRYTMYQERQLLFLSYKPQTSSQFFQEYSIRYQNQTNNWDTFLIPTGTTNYPSGLREFLNMSTQDLFGRVQYAYEFATKARILAGLETAVLHYSGDDEHLSNVDINAGGTFAPFPDGRTKKLGPYYPWIVGKNIWNIAAYSQVQTGQLISSWMEMTLGIRYDREFFNFIPIDGLDTNNTSKRFERASPRLSLVFLPSENFTFKLMGGTAFRIPSLGELFASNSYFGASNFRELEPETVHTIEAASDWRINPEIDWRLNLFATRFEKFIAYSGVTNLSTNIFSMSNAGFESELLFQLTERGTGFTNYSFVRKLNESIEDSSVSLSPKTVVWVPAHTFNLGTTFDLFQNFRASLQLHIQGDVPRRQSDTSTYPNDRPSTIGSWTTIDSNFQYEFTEHVTVGLQIRNLLNSQNQRLISARNTPFDYFLPGRVFLATLNARL